MQGYAGEKKNIETNKKLLAYVQKEELNSDLLKEQGRKNRKTVLST